MQRAQQGSFEPFDDSQWHIALVVAQFNQHITGALQDSALKRAAEYRIPDANITTISVAGSIEVPLALQQLAKTTRYDALLAIGCIIRGDTPHFDYVAKYVTEGILRVQLDYDMPIGFGVLTCDTEAQAEARAQLGSAHLDAVLHQAKAIRTEAST
jgi:6,7-dimethyl-8-ribityllumazine synthase